MKAGTENKTELRIAIVLVAIAAILIVRTFVFGGSSSTPAPAATPTASAPAAQKVAQQPTETLDPRLNLGLLANSENVKYEGHGKNIFTGGAAPINIPKVLLPPLKRQQQAATQPANYVPPPPPINLKYFGLASAKGEKPRAFLSQGEDIWIAREGEVVNRHYKIVRISPRDIEVEDLLNNNRQNIPLTQV